METLQAFITQYSGVHAYAVFFFIVLICTFGLFNSDITFITAGVLSSVHFFDFRILIILGFIALITGDSIVFLCARKWGRELIRKKPFSMFLKENKIQAAENYFQQKGKYIVFFVRFIPLTRTYLFFTAGTLQVKPKFFYLFNILSTAIYLPLVIIGSHQAGANANRIALTVKKYQFLPLAIFISFVLFFYFKNKKEPTV